MRPNPSRVKHTIFLFSSFLFSSKDAPFLHTRFAPHARAR